MTALDQALIKAFTQQGAAKPTAGKPAAVSRPTTPGLKSSREKDKPRKPKTKPAPTAVKRSARVKPEKLRPHRTHTAKASVMVHRKPKTPAKPSPVHADGLWAVLEESPRAASTKAKPVAPKAHEKKKTPPTLVVEALNPVLPPSQENPPVETHAVHENRSAELAARPENVGLDLSPPERSIAPVAEDLLPPASNEPEFKPAWQVDRFTWPTVCRRLIAEAGDELDRLADFLLDTRTESRKVLAICGCCRGEGATTLLLCLARRLAERGVKPALVDADCDRPRLARRLGVEPQFGWDEASDDPTSSLDRAMVEATANHLALLPLRGGSEPRTRWTNDPSQLSRALRTLRPHYDIVLVDLGPLEAMATGGAARLAPGAIDGALLVHNPQTTSDECLERCQERLAAFGVPVMGILENFVPQQVAAE
ncbi:MAG: cellulose synthase operon protein YhjQ/BcsQ [Thermoguttaceae bacterium]